MSSKPSFSFNGFLLIVLLASLFPGQAAHRLEPDQSLVQTAGRRSQNAAKTIRVVTDLPKDETIPVELFNRAQAIGVFPDVVRMNLLFSQGMKGYGVISSRQADGWSLPSYYRFGSSTFSLKMAGGKSFDLIILFMNKETVNWFQKGRLEFKGVKAGVSGPLGKWTPKIELNTLGLNLIYIFVDGKLKGMSVESDFWEGSLLDPDNNINNAVYGMKGSQVLLGKEPKSPLSAPDVTAFRDILKEKFPVSK